MKLKNWFNSAIFLCRRSEWYWKSAIAFFGRLNSFSI